MHPLRLKAQAFLLSFIYKYIVWMCISAWFCLCTCICICIQCKFACKKCQCRLPIKTQRKTCLYMYLNISCREKLCISLVMIRCNRVGLFVALVVTN